ncbi:M20 family metallopeptidase [Youngiibacter fragilis]|uniref:Peptidase M20 domain-containing protein 2 n=1 Tax=Youngiibacter fragilis 232.1 TaxID=994573 RepID=V7IBT3_9CLOT|nr:M20 family metallopeptidase [Youngiibacter fragilis]ETA82337.1 amidohydrolase [Youngiibacter fragilis 232.1]
MDLKTRVQDRVDEVMGDLSALSAEIWSNPEYNFEEHKAMEAFSRYLRKYGFDVETGIGGIGTAVRAVFTSGKEGPVIGIFGEYDAVPGTGHACGHNLMAAMAVGAGAAVASVIEETGGTVVVFGTPAEEGGGGKVIMLENGAFEGLDAAMVLHPANETVVNDISYSRTDLVVDFYGKKSHAATWPEEGISALTPVLELFNLLNAMKLEIGDRGKILGVISKGGDEPIYVPDHCQARFTVRSFSMKDKIALVKKLIDTCEGLAKITGTRLEYSQEGKSYEDIRNNPVIEGFLHKNFEALGEKVMPRRKELGIGCTDMGNVTHRIPSLQSYVQVVPILRGHTPEFQEAVGGPMGIRALNIGAKAMAMTAVDLLTGDNAMELTRDAFSEMKIKHDWEDDTWEM